MARNKRKGGREGTSVRGDKAKHGEATQAPIDRLATETKALIASFPPRADAAKLALVSRSWNGPAEQTVWRMLHIDGHYVGNGGERLLIGGPELIDEQWRELEQALIARPLRYSYIRFLTVANTEFTGPIMTRILCRLPGLTYLRHIRYYRAYDAEWLS